MKILQALRQTLVGNRERSKLSGKFVDLAPTNQADENGIYFEALDYAANNASVFNIALTGPYGSGKSSVIKSFLTRYTRPYLQISLASFVSEIAADAPSPLNKESERGYEKSKERSQTASKQEIERALLHKSFSWIHCVNPA